MIEIITQLGIMLLCLATIGLHVAKKNDTEVILYSMQSFAIIVLLVAALLQNSSLELLLIAAVTLGVKVIFAPIFFSKLIRRHKIKFESHTYANVPETLFALTALFLLINTQIFAPIINIAGDSREYLVLALWLIFASVLLMANRKGALSQATGVLSLENSIVAFGIFAGLEQSAALQMGILFDVSVWLVIAIVMVSMIYKHIGSLDVTKMKDLRG